MSGNFDFLDGPRRRGRRPERGDDASKSTSDFLFGESSAKARSKPPREALFFEKEAQQATRHFLDPHVDVDTKYVEVEGPNLEPSNLFEGFEVSGQAEPAASIWQTAEDGDWEQLAKIDPELAAELYARSQSKTAASKSAQASSLASESLDELRMDYNSRRSFENPYVDLGPRVRPSEFRSSSQSSSNPYLDDPELDATPYLSYFPLDQYPSASSALGSDRRFSEAGEQSSLASRQGPRLSLRTRIKRVFRILKISLVLLTVLAFGVLVYLFRAGYTPIRLKMILELQEGKSEVYTLRKQLIGAFPESVDFVHALSKSQSPKRAEFNFDFPKRDLGLVPLSQYDLRWAFEEYNGVYLGDSGSAPLCLASLALSDQNQGLHPLAIAAYMKAFSFDLGLSGTSPEGIDAFAAQFLPELKSISSQREALQAACARGKIVLIESCDDEDPNRLDNGYFLLLHLDSEGRGTIFDPRKPSSRNRTINLDSILSKLKNAWIYEH